ncbi:RICIN domain-containing protein [Streptomyces sp. NPDC093097]|uniref:RICIN domain-containing protein n=1 Tax=Streptomyces sp. NPDC093097 TaxID=3366027 RepID=UPI003816BE0F
MNLSKARIATGSVFLATALAGGVAMAGPAAAASSGVLKNVSTGYCLDGNGGSAYVGKCNGGSYQKWSLAKNSDGTYKIYNGTGKCLDSNTTPNIYMGGCNSGSFQKWKLSGGASGYRIQNLATGFCVDSNATPRLYMSKCNAGNYQRWAR